MNPVVPQAGHEGAEFFEMGLGQEEYAVLPAYRSPDGLVMTEWSVSPEEAELLRGGGRVRLWVHTFNVPLQPVSLEVVEAP